MSHDDPNSTPQIEGGLKKSYKVVLESVTKEKKKLQSTESYDLHAPSGYTFVPVGVPDLTEYCKELSRKRGLQVFVVSSEPTNRAHKNPNNISHHIHRTGHHVQNDVVDVACETLGYSSHGPRYIRPNKQRSAGPLAIARRLDSYGEMLRASGREVSPGRERKKVAGAIKDLFPKIPHEDQDAIVARAFEEGTTRVGNADLPLARRVQLAVLAHIRHRKTDYDKLLKATNWQVARSRVEQACLEQIVKWRGEDEEGEDELEDIFQEVIILDDESDNEPSRTRDSSVELASNTAIATDLGKNGHHQSQHPHAGAPRQVHSRDELEIIHVQPRRIIVPPRLFRQRWNEARARVGFSTPADNRTYMAHEAPLQYVRDSNASTRNNEYEVSSSVQSQLQPLSQTSNLWPLRGQIGGDKVNYYSTGEVQKREQANDRPRRYLGVQEDKHSTSFDREPIMLYERAANSREVDINRPFYVPEGHEMQSEYASHRLHGGNTSLQNIKRRSITDPITQLRQPDQDYSRSPAKRPRLIDEQDSSSLPPSARISPATWSHARYDPIAQDERAVQYELLEVDNSYRDSNSSGRYSTQTHHRRIQPQHPREVAYSPRDETNEFPRRIYVGDDRPLVAVDGNVDRLRLFERTQQPQDSPSVERGLRQQRAVIAHPSIMQEPYREPLQYRPRINESIHPADSPDRYAPTYGYRAAATQGPIESPRPPIQPQHADLLAESQYGQYIRPRQMLEASPGIPQRRRPPREPQAYSPRLLPQSQADYPGRAADKLSRLHARRR